MITAENLSPETIQFGLNTLYSLVAIGILTSLQRRAIKKRDGETCQFPEEHSCRGKLTVHHIIPLRGSRNGNGKNDIKANDSELDVPEKLITICNKSHEKMTNSGKEEYYAPQFLEIARRNTEEAIKNTNWQFPPFEVESEDEIEKNECSQGESNP